MKDRGSDNALRSQRREESRRVLRRLRRDALWLASAYRLPLRSLEAERANVKRRYGVCYDDGSIRVRLRHLRTGELLKYSSLIDTVCHELAHLRHFDHGPHFEALYHDILAHARRRGIYRPAPRVARAPRVQQSSILPLARLEPRPRRTAKPAARPAARRRAGGPEQLELFR
jgi:predicted metal-dependent hydrolase